MLPADLQGFEYHCSDSCSIRFIFVEVTVVYVTMAWQQVQLAEQRIFLRVTCHKNGFDECLRSHLLGVTRG